MLLQTALDSLFFRRGARSPRPLPLLQGAALLVFAYLCAGELLPLPVLRASRVLQGWAVQQVILLAALSFLAVLAGASAGVGRGCPPLPAACVLAALNTAPIAAAVAALHLTMSDNCPVAPGRPCDTPSILADVVGLTSARLARLDLGVCLLLAARGEAAVLHATGGYLGYSEVWPPAPPASDPSILDPDTPWPLSSSNPRAAHHPSSPLQQHHPRHTVPPPRSSLAARLPALSLAPPLLNARLPPDPQAQPLHRAAGWWCAGQSALHSLAYFFFYLRAGGAASLWQACFPAPLPDGSLNRLGLVNFMGVVAIAVCGPLALSALPLVRRRCYHAFQRLHMPVALLFVTCCALHDLAILTFAVPGIAFWYVEWRGRGGRKGVLGCSLRRFTATARLLPGTSGPWAELTIHCGGAALGHDAAPRGEWVSLRAPARQWLLASDQ